MSSTTGAQGSRNCVSCGRAIQWDANVCPYCGHDYRARFMPMAAPPREAGRARTGGILILVAGILGVIMGILFLALSTVDFEAAGATFTSDFTQRQLHQLFAVWGVVALVMGVISVFGGIFALQKRYYPLVIAGGVTGIIGVGFVVGTILAIIGLILVALARNEFEAQPMQPAPMPPPPYQMR